MLLLAIASCHHHVSSWRDVATETGCTPALLASTPAYDSTQVSGLVGSYRLVQVDTSAGWIDVEREHGSPARGHPLRLWAADSVSARWGRNPLSGKPIRLNRPIVGALAGYENQGFSSENPQVAVTSRALDHLVVHFTPHLVLDGPLWLLPIEHVGSWGFGGYFVEESNVVPIGRDGEPLGQRAGFYCAFRR